MVSIISSITFNLFFFSDALLCDKYDSQSEIFSSNQNGTSYQQTIDNQSSKYPDLKATTYEPYISDPFFKSHSCSSLYDTRAPDVIDWDRTQPRHIEYYRKPIGNIPLSFRTKHASSDDTHKMQNFNTLLQSKQPKYTTNLS